MRGKHQSEYYTQLETQAGDKLITSIISYKLKVFHPCWKSILIVFQFSQWTILETEAISIVAFHFLYRAETVCPGLLDSTALQTVICLK